jgi:hypothetical protein
VLNTKDDTEPLTRAYTYQFFALNYPYLPTTTKPVVEQIVRRLEVPANGKQWLSVTCGSGFPISGGWENVVGNMGVYYSRMSTIHPSEWEVRVWNKELTAKTVGIRASGSPDSEAPFCCRPRPALGHWASARCLRP